MVVAEVEGRGGTSAVMGLEKSTGKIVNHVLTEISL